MNKNESNTMKTKLSCLLVIGPLATVLTGCRILDVTMLDPTGISGTIKAAREQKKAEVKAREAEQDQQLMGQRLKITTGFAANPDTDAWKEERAKISQAAGERLFSKDYSRVFDSLVVAASSLELQVNNMERQSGYITASGICLSPTEAKALKRQAINDWCVQNTLDPSVLDRQYHLSMFNSVAESTDVGNVMAKTDNRHRALTFRLDKLGENRTRVTLRFSEIYYPAELEAYYNLVWKSVDKQIFVDQAINDDVAQRK